MEKTKTVAVCEECLILKKNRTLETIRFHSTKQAKTERLQHFSNTLNGLAAQCEFGTQGKILDYDIFIWDMQNVTVQERPFTQPKERPEKGLQFAVASEEGIRRQKSCKVAEIIQIKTELVPAITE